MDGISIRGDLVELEELEVKLELFASDSTRKEINQRVAEAELSLLRLEFERSEDPYGNAWAPLKRRDGQPLLDTGRLRNSFSAVNVSAGQFTIGTRVEYAGPHQDGATIRHPARINVHNKGNGRFKKNARGANSRYQGATLSFAEAHESQLPRRQMLPEGEWGERWWKAIEAEVDDALSTIFGER